MRRYSPAPPLVLGAALTLFACGEGAQLRGKVAGLQKIAAEAKSHGAEKCAPRELALAESHLQFAELELEQGSVSAAKRHLWLAEPNTHAAFFLSPAAHCLDKVVAPLAPKPADRDGDGLLDSVDKCPDNAENYNGFEDADGCPDDPDTDGDSIKDSLDSCVLTPEDLDKYLDDDGCPDLDDDADGVLDVTDKCRLEPEDPDGYQDDDGCPEPDNDQDKVLDVEDGCPNEIGPVDANPKGCPVKPALVVVTDCEVKITQQIHFEFNKATIRKESYPVLDAVVDVLRTTPAIKLEIQGHTDNKGSPAYNKKLSDKRAASVLKYLVDHGVTTDRLTSHGYGLERPIVSNDTDLNRSLNRRVQFVRTEGTKEGCPK